jgi:DMSO/TMAO reductase YedYZ molybdopterin-dependent catalytic subunit
LVERPRTVRFDDLLRYSKAELVSVHECCGSPFAPFEPTRRVGNVRWGGARLVDILEDCRPSKAAQYVWSYGADVGESGGRVVDAYVKDLPLSRVEADFLIGYEMISIGWTPTRRGGAGWCWLRWPRGWMGCSSRSRGDAMRPMTCR